MGWQGSVAAPAFQRYHEQGGSLASPALPSCSRAVDRIAAGAVQQGLAPLAAVRAALAATTRLEGAGLACRARGQRGQGGELARGCNRQ